MQDNYQKFYVGINVFAVKNNRLLLGKRKNIYGAGTWGLSGGHLEPREKMENAAARELKEETGLKAASFDFANLVNDMRENEHRLQIGFIAKDISGKPEIKEPDRCEEWKLFELNNLPENIFPPHIKQINNFLKDLKFSDE